jgi:purine-binding chemotaxis protein CheW
MADSEGARAAVTEEQSVIMELGDETYGVNIGLVQEIIRMQAITSLPGTPEFVEGVINLRGKVIPVIDLKRRLGVEVAPVTDESRIVVVDVRGQTIGMVVDGVSEVLRIPSDTVEPPASAVKTGDSDYINGIAKLEDRMVILLNLDKVMAWQEEERKVA